MKNKIIISIFAAFFLTIKLFPVNWEYGDYKKWDEKNFKNNPLFLETLDFNKIDYPRLDAVVFYATNEQRVKYNLKRLEFNPLLEKQANLHSKNMAVNNFFSHNDPVNKKFSTPEDRAIFVGIANPKIAENVASSFAIRYRANTPVFILDKEAGTFSYAFNGLPIPNHTYLSFALEVVELWMKSKGHRSNIMSPNTLELGCGTFFLRDKNFYNIPKILVTQDFQWYYKIIVR